jgi:PAS domain S-box-containing protein
MSEIGLQLLGFSDPRLAIHAAGALPAWLWATDGSRVLWANPVGARAFGAANGLALAARSFGPADAHRRQIAQLARRLPETGAVRLERLRGFGAPLGTLATCGCSRFELPDGSHLAAGRFGILITTTDTGLRTMPLAERLQRLVDDSDAALIAFTTDGLPVGASASGRRLLGALDLNAQHLAQARDSALADGHAEVQLDHDRITLYRVGSDAQLGLIAWVRPVEAETPALDAAQAPRQPLRFMWQMDADEHFTLDSDAFIRVMGSQMAAQLGRPWRELAESFGLDPDGCVSNALETHETWSGIIVPWPVDGGGTLSVELSGLPAYDEERHFVGHRGFGVCRDLEALDRLDAQRQDVSDAAPTATPVEDAAQSDHTGAADMPPDGANLAEGAPHDPVEAHVTEPSAPLPSGESGGPGAPGNVVPFRPGGESKFPALTPVENSAFHELARQLSARLESARLEGDFHEARAEAIARPETTTMPPVTEPPRGEPADDHAMDDGAAQSAPDWLAPEAPSPQGDSLRDRILLDLLPGGVLIYRLDRLLYANDAFLAQIGYASLAALEQAGGLDALYVEPGVSTSSSTSEAGTPVMISAADGNGLAAAARLFTISWDGDTAHALIFTPRPDATAATAPQPAQTPVSTAPPPPAPQPLVIPPLAAAGQADAEDLGAILDVTAEGILMFDAGGNIHACNRSAEALFGYDGAQLIKRNLIELFATESTRLVLDYLESVREAGVASLLDQGREVLGRVSQGGLIPLSITIGRTRPAGPNFFAVFRDLSQTRRGENELSQARRLADRAANAKADMLARISHEVRAPLNAIIGFAEVMIGERFGALGNARYLDYMKDIRSSGERVVTLINDLLELSRIETGKLDLAFTNQNLNELVESCVAIMQPHANRARIIIRTSLSHALPPVVADARALRQIALNLISTSIALANPGGQVIVSTALSDFGQVVLRVRDTGHGLNDREVAAALEPFRPQPSEQASDNAGLSLSLTKALVEANRAQFHIKAAPKSGTLMEVVFSRALARNQSA